MRCCSVVCFCATSRAGYGWKGGGCFSCCNKHCCIVCSIKCPGLTIPYSWCVNFTQGVTITRLHCTPHCYLSKGVPRRAPLTTSAAQLNDCVSAHKDAYNQTWSNLTSARHVKSLVKPATADSPGIIIICPFQLWCGHGDNLPAKHNTPKSCSTSATAGASKQHASGVHSTVICGSKHQR